ncbi:hypothetical protein HDU76_001749 [Blyttiomyces sp. JEL0837]|nr:hypothetical protein HDU76_001749 [Blyttiomyces sp. JEL0837]
MSSPPNTDLNGGDEPMLRSTGINSLSTEVLVLAPQVTLRPTRLLDSLEKVATQVTRGLNLTSSLKLEKIQNLQFHSIEQIDRCFLGIRSLDLRHGAVQNLEALLPSAEYRDIAAGSGWTEYIYSLNQTISVA